MFDNGTTGEDDDDDDDVTFGSPIKQAVCNTSATGENLLDLS